MPKLARLLAGALACSAVTVFLAGTASATITTGNLIGPHSTKYVSDGDYGVRSDNFGSPTWLDNQGERGFRITRSTADSSRVTAYPNIFRGWQWGVGTSGNWPVRVSDDHMPRADFAVHQTWKGTYDASLDLWFSTYPNKTTQTDGAEIMIWLSHPHVLAGGRKIRVDGTDWYLNEWKTKGHGLTWALIIFTHATPVSSVKHLWLNPFSAWIAETGPVAAAGTGPVALCPDMNGAQSLLATLTGNGIGVCFANPGTSEMHVVAALDQAPGLRCVLGLFEGVVTGAADGYARMTGRPAATLLHLGPGLANGLSNLHNAMRAQSPVVNVIGDHATYHRRYDAPLTSDVEGTARPFSHWVRTTPDADSVAADAAAAIAAARTAPGRVASLILPADAAWTPLTAAFSPAQAVVPVPPPVPEPWVGAAARILRSGETTALLLGPQATWGEPLERAGQIAAAYPGKPSGLAPPGRAFTSWPGRTRTSRAR
jgi:hypothetical protein